MIDVKKIRQDFPMYRKDSKYGNLPLHYLDNAATSFKPYSVIKAVDHYYEDISANAHRGDYPLAHDVDVAFEGSRNIIAKFMNADPKEVCFTAGDSMGMNQVAYGLMPILKEGDEIVLSFEEHASNVLPWFKVAKLTKAVIKYVPLTKEGRITPENLKKVLSPRTKIVSLAIVSNVLGYLLPIKELVKLTHEVGALFVADAAQSIGHLKTDVKDLDVDFLCFSSHKMCGPMGLGVMYGKYDLLDKMEPVFSGGEMNARFNSCGMVSLEEPPLKFEAGTQNIPGVMGLAAACQYLEQVGFDNIDAHERHLKQMAVEGLKKNGNAVIYNPDSEAGIITFNINKVFAQDAASYLASKGVFVRSGQHCAKILPEFLNTQATVRASLYFYNDEDDIKALIEACKHAEDFLDVFFN
ncbi:MAG: aminotransferase class V-fold PLP-dependent enzyme [Bacilli bacterium]